MPSSKNLETKIPITPEFLENIRNHKKRTIVGTFRLLKDAHAVPKGLTPILIERWLNGTTTRATKEHLDFVLNAWEILPSCPHEFIVLDDKTIDRLNAYKEKTGIGSLALLNNCSKDLPDGLSPRMIDHWINRRTKEARKDHLNFVLELWETIPQYEFIELNADYLEQLQRSKAKTEKGIGTLLSETPLPIPEGLNAKVVNGWLKGSGQEARLDHFDFVIDLWENAASENRTPITKEIIARLKRYQLKSGVSPTRLLKHTDCIPDKLNASVILSWLDGSVKMAEPGHLEFVMKLWGKQPYLKEQQPKKKSSKPSKISKDRVSIEEYAERLDNYRKKGFLPSQVFESAEDVPEGLRYPMVSSWLNGGSKTAKKSHIDYVLRKCRAMEESPQRRVKITEDMRKALKHESERTDLGPKTFLDRIKEYPEGISATIISSWMHGRAQTVRKDHFDFVLRAWSKL